MFYSTCSEIKVNKNEKKQILYYIIIFYIYIFKKIVLIIFLIESVSLASHQNIQNVDKYLDYINVQVQSGEYFKYYKI